MNIDNKEFERKLGRSVPGLLKKFFDNEIVRKGGPIRFEFTNKAFIVEIQYFLGLPEENNSDIENSRFAFAVDTNGYEMLIDLAVDDLPILQKENGVLDSIDVTLSELLSARIVPV